MSKKKILIIRFSAIGDIVLTTPVIRCLKTQINDVEIHFCTKEANASLMENNPYVDKVHLLNQKGLGDLLGRLRAEKFDIVVDLHKNLRSTLLCLLLGKRRRTYEKLTFERWLYIRWKVNQLPNRHVVDRYMDAVRPLGVKMDFLGLDYFIPDRDEVENDWLPETHRDQYVVFAIGAQHQTKRLPVKRMIELCDRINKPVILLGNKAEAEDGEKIAAFFEKKQSNAIYEEGLGELGKRTVIFNACGKFNLNQSASIIKNAKAVFTHDTSLMHIAAAFKKQIFCIWGSTSPHFGMYPYRTRFTIFENNKLSCRPCHKHGHAKCPKGHFKCMNDLIFDFYLP